MEEKQWCQKCGKEIGRPGSIHIMGTVCRCPKEAEPHQKICMVKGECDHEYVVGEVFAGELNCKHCGILKSTIDACQPKEEKKTDWKCPYQPENGFCNIKGCGYDHSPSHQPSQEPKCAGMACQGEKGCHCYEKAPSPDDWRQRFKNAFVHLDICFINSVKCECTCYYEKCKAFISTELSKAQQEASEETERDLIKIIRKVQIDDNFSDHWKNGYYQCKEEVLNILRSLI